MGSVCFHEVANFVPESERSGTPYFTLFMQADGLVVQGSGSSLTQWQKSFEKATSEMRQKIGNACKAVGKPSVGPYAKYYAGKLLQMKLFPGQEALDDITAVIIMLVVEAGNVREEIVAHTLAVLDSKSGLFVHPSTLPALSPHLPKVPWDAATAIVTEMLQVGVTIKNSLVQAEGESLVFEVPDDTATHVYYYMTYALGKQT